MSSRSSAVCVISLLVCLVMLLAAALPVAAAPATAATLPAGASSGLLHNIVAITAGSQHTCALTADGGVKCWGSNWKGQIGDGTRGADRLTLAPVDVIGFPSGVQAISAGQGHTCALTTEGGVKCWGDNMFGQLGNGNSHTDDGVAPVDVIGLGGVQAIAAGSDHTCALTIEGGVKCWGVNWDGQLGNGANMEERPTPVDVIGLTGGVQAIAAGGSNTCALTLEGGVKCWGNNEVGQVGDGTAGENRLAPVDVIGLSSDIRAIATGAAHACALTIGGGVKCWGYNEQGQLGDGTHGGSRLTPVDVVGLTSGVRVVVAGWRHTCALTTGGGVKCWGDNWAGPVGDGSNGARGMFYRLTPVDVVGLTSGVQAVAAGGDHTCALMADGGVKCWGGNYYGQLGNGARITSWEQLAPVAVAGLTSGVRAVAGGGAHTCALTTGGGVQCWGDNEHGQVGDGVAGANRLAPVEVVGPADGVQSLAAGGHHTCALTTAGGVQCWGDNQYGQLGSGASGADQPTPVDVIGLSRGVRAIAAGDLHTCALTASGGVKCWGHNSSGQVGDGTNGVDRLEPVDVSGLTRGVQAIAAGGAHTCALTAGGSVKCWGYNEYGQVGDGTTIDRPTPVDVSGLTSGVQAIAGGYTHTCAVTTSGGVKCWGRNQLGQVGDGTTWSTPLTPVDVVGLTSGVQVVAAGADHTCALTTGGGLKCWGSNYFGQFGDGTGKDRWTPVSISNLSSGVEAITAGAYHMCALTSGTGDGSGVKCWGKNWNGQLAINPGWTPMDVIVQSPAAFLPLIRMGGAD